MPYTHKDFVPPGYEIESVAGTDVATTRVAFPGELVDFQFMPEFPKEVSSGPATYTPVGAYGTFFNMGCRVTLKPYFDDLATSLLALLLGTINAGTGVITVADQRTFTVQGGLDLGTDIYRRMRNCRVASFRREYAFGEPTVDTYDIVGISRPTADTQATAWAAAPATLAGSPWVSPGPATHTFSSRLTFAPPPPAPAPPPRPAPPATLAGSPWVSPGHVTHTFSSGLTFAGAVESGSIEINRGSTTVKGLNQTDRVPTSTYTGGIMEVKGSVKLLPDDHAAFVAYYTDPQTSGGTFTQTINFTKNAAAQYSNWVITKCLFRDFDPFHWRRNVAEGITWDIPWEMGADSSAGGTLAVDTVS